MILNRLPKSIDLVIDKKLRAVDKFVAEFIDPLSDIGNPEKLIGKPFEQWTPQELEMMKSIYSGRTPNPLANLIFRKAYERVKELEQSL